MSVNKVILLGNLGADPEIRRGQNGAILRLNVATSERWQDKRANEWKERTEWHNVVMFGDRAEEIGRELRKGARVFVEGQLKSRTYEKDGQERQITEIVAQTIVGAGGR